VGHWTQTHGDAQDRSELMRVVLAGRFLGGARGDVAVITRPPVQEGQAVAITGTCPERAGSVAVGWLDCDGGVTPRIGDAVPFDCCRSVQLLGKLLAIEVELDLLYDAVEDELGSD
jgi:hypothetical protein